MTTHPSILPPDTTQAGAAKKPTCPCGEPANPKSTLGLCGPCNVKRLETTNRERQAGYYQARKAEALEIPCACGCGRLVPPGRGRKYFSPVCSATVAIRRQQKKRKNLPPTPKQRAASQPEPQAPAPYRLPGLRDSGDEDCPERAKAVNAILARVGRGR